jgi:hypothetical protein
VKIDHHNTQPFHHCNCRHLDDENSNLAEQFVLLLHLPLAVGRKTFLLQKHLERIEELGLIDISS